MEMKVATETPPRYESKDDPEAGIYVLVNKASRTTLDLSAGNPKHGTKVQGYHRVCDEWFGGSRWALQHRDENGAWILSNLKSATFLDILDGYGCFFRNMLACCH